MNTPPFDPDYRQLSQSIRVELSRLLDSVHDQLASDSQIARLNEILRENAQARQYYLRYVDLNCQLATIAGRVDRTRAEELNQLVTFLTSADELLADDLAIPNGRPLTTAISPHTSHSARRAWAMGLAAMILVAITTWMLRHDYRDSAHREQPSAKLLDVVADANIRQTPKAAAVVSFASESSRLEESDQPPVILSSLEPGTTVNLSDGEIELTYQSGTKLRLIGPARFLVAREGGRLSRGGLIASVTEAGHGFTIETLHGKVVDLGTEFGVAVDDFGVSEVSVFSGKVEAFPEYKGAVSGQKIELTQGHGLQWTGDGAIALEADRKRFASANFIGNWIGQDRIANAIIVRGQFAGGLIDNDQWQAMGSVRSSQGGLILQGENRNENLPYIISSNQFDPSQGSVTVSCVVRFVDLKEATKTSLSLLTRSDNYRGVAPAAWTGILGSSVRCSLDLEPNARDGILAAAVKLEDDREPTQISWRGFGPIEENVPYRLQMHDDGVKVVFTVSLLDDPTIKKVVTFRSLFRGQKNFVAVEGPRDGTVIVDQVEIVQQQPTLVVTNERNSLQDVESLPLNDSNELSVDYFENLLPTDAVSVLQDSFSDQLDSQKWTTLGEVMVHDGAVQLGMPNEAAHINTWHPRPYLIPKQQFDATEGKLTIMGKIRFAENFLNGYGASFAVMTRAENVHGTGPGWENSVLRTGVRSNFWPAAWDYEHSLEIHEKPESNTITLLATQGLQVDSQARTYLFCVVDDGQSVELTIVDAKNPSVRKTIAHPTSLRGRGGYVGFESCWGSPITLDDVRIYQSKSESTE